MIAYHAETGLEETLRCDGIRRVHFRADGSPYFEMAAGEDLIQAAAKPARRARPKAPAGVALHRRGKAPDVGVVVRDEAVRAQVVEDVRAFGTGDLGLDWIGVCESPIRGAAGNVEYTAYWRKPA